MTFLGSVFVCIAVFAVIIVDQLTKLWAVSCLAPVGEIELIRGALYFTYATNDGMAFGLLGEHRWVFLLATSLIIGALIAFFIVTRKKKKHPLLCAAFACILGGGISNMIDRVFYGTALFSGRVIDFIDFRLIHFAVFNLADAAVCIGEALLILYVLFIDGKIKDPAYFAFSGGAPKAGRAEKADEEAGEEVGEEAGEEVGKNNQGK